VRAGEKNYLTLYMSFTVLSGYDWDDVKTEISLELASYINSTLDFGAKLEFSDLTHGIRTNVEGVDNIKINQIVSQGQFKNLPIATYTSDILFDDVSYLIFNDATYDSNISYTEV